MEKHRIPRKKKKENQKIFFKKLDKWFDCRKKSDNAGEHSFIHNEIIFV